MRRALATPLPRLSCAERPCRPPRRLSCADRPMLNNCRLYNHYHLRGEMPAVEYLLQAADPTNRVPLSLDVVVRIAGALQIWEVVRCASWSWGRGHYHDATKFASSLASASIKRDILYHALGYRPATYLLCFMVRSSTRPATQRTRPADPAHACADSLGSTVGAGRSDSQPNAVVAAGVRTRYERGHYCVLRRGFVPDGGCRETRG